MGTWKFAVPLAGALLCVALAGCGGGGGSSDHDNDSSGGTVCTTPDGFNIDAGSNQHVKTGALVQLDGSASTNVEGARSYKWAFSSRPNGSSAKLSSATSAAPTFTPDLDGQYVVNLVVDGVTCDGSTGRVTVTSTRSGANSVPDADAGQDQSVTVGDRVTLDGGNSRDADGDTLTYKWRFVSRPSGSSAKLSGAGSVAPAFTADVAGSYIVRLKVNDGKASSARDEVSVVAAAKATVAPVADAGPDQSVHTGAGVGLDGTASSDANNKELSYAWTLVSKPSDSGAELAEGNTPQPKFDADRDGSYVARLVVDNGKTKSRPDTVVVLAATANSRPTADAGPNQSVKTGIVVNLDGSDSQDIDSDDKLTYRWSFVSIPSDSQTALTGESRKTPTFTPDVEGKYVVRLIVNDGKLDSTADTVTITAAQGNSAPVADAGPSQGVAVQSKVELDGSASSDADDDSLTYAWRFMLWPSGSKAALSGASTAQPTFTADKRGVYRLKLTVNDGQLDSEPSFVNVIARPVLALFVDRSTDGSGDYQRVVNGSPATRISLHAGDKNALLNQFRLKAVGQNYQISNRQVTTDAGNSQPYFDGLNDDTKIAAGDTLDFATRLRAVPATKGSYQVELQFIVKPADGVKAAGVAYKFEYTVNVE